MALFESYERREKQILAVLAQYDIKSIEEAKAICDEKGFLALWANDCRSVFRGVQSLCRRCLG